MNFDRSFRAHVTCGMVIYYIRLRNARKVIKKINVLRFS